MLLNLIYMERYIGFKPIVHEEDRLLILGSMPSVMSIEQNMYYANPTNRFWKMLGYLFDMEYESKEQKLNILETNHIALWDICHSCKRHKSSDASIQEVVANDIPGLLAENPTIKKVICNGKTSYATLKKFYPHIECVVCPSTSSANARYTLEDLVREYKGVLK